MAADGSSSTLEKCMQTIDKEKSHNFVYDPDAMVDFQSCVQLMKPPTVDRSDNCMMAKCNLSVSCSNDCHGNSTGAIISRLLVISECKRVEVLYGKSGEYKFTKLGEVLDDSDPQVSRNNYSTWAQLLRGKPSC